MEINATRRRKKFAGIAMLVAVMAVWIWDANRVKPLGTKRVDLGNGVTMDFVWIPAGEFMMGSLRVRWNAPT
jgi:formylglycine-generating enzyme required for sulfatase activity